MKKSLTLLLVALCMAVTGVMAQTPGTNTEIYVLDLKVNGNVVATFRKGDCGFSAADGWGGVVVGDFCLPIVWAYDITPDSLGCDTITNNYAGKMVMIRRGACEFGRKGLNAQNAGASAVAIVNATLAANPNAGNECLAPGMAAGAVGAQVTIPQLMFSRIMADQIDAALKAGQQPEICFRRLSLYDPSAEYSHLTPVGQGVPVELIAVNCVNRSGLDQEFVGKCVITDPAGTVTEILSEPIFIAADADSLITFETSYTPPAGLTGLFNLQFTADKSPGESVSRSFRITPHTWATDNLNRNGGAANDQSYIDGGRVYQTGSVVVTGTGGEVKLVTFGIENAAAMADTLTPETNIVNVLLYDADVNDDNVNDLGNGLTAFDGLTIVSFAEVLFDRNTTNELQNVELIPIDGDNILKPNHLYYVSLKYDGSSNSTYPDKSISFSTSSDVYYDVRIGSHTPLRLDNYYNAGWGGANVITRLHEAAYDPAVSVNANILDKVKYSVTPNPTADWVNLNLELKGENKTVNVEIIDNMGRTMTSQVKKNFKNGRVSFDSRSLPSGNYYVYVRTSDEGSAMVPVMICH
jgi:hypothetical protein